MPISESFIFGAFEKEDTAGEGEWILNLDDLFDHEDDNWKAFVSSGLNESKSNVDDNIGVTIGDKNNSTMNNCS